MALLYQRLSESPGAHWEGCQTHFQGTELSLCARFRIVCEASSHRAYFSSNPELFQSRDRTGVVGQPDPAVVPDRAFRLFGLRVLNVTLKGRILFSE